MATQVREIGQSRLSQLIARLEQVLITLFDRLYQRQEQARQRRLLLSLSDDTLKDIGISRSELEGSNGHPFA